MNNSRKKQQQWITVKRYPKSVGGVREAFAEASRRISKIRARVYAEAQANKEKRGDNK